MVQTKACMSYDLLKRYFDISNEVGVFYSTKIYGKVTTHRGNNTHVHVHVYIHTHMHTLNLLKTHIIVFTVAINHIHESTWSTGNWPVPSISYSTVQVSCVKM